MLKVVCQLKCSLPVDRNVVVFQLTVVCMLKVVCQLNEVFMLKVICQLNLSLLVDRSLHVESNLPVDRSLHVESSLCQLHSTVNRSFADVDK